MTTCYIALGSNLDNPLTQVTQAVHELASCGVVIAQSPWYQSEAIGPGTQHDYINGVVCLDTTLCAEQLLSCLQAIEQQHGRVRTVRWGARTLDLDILFFGDTQIKTPTLEVPHPRITERAFVVFPLADIAPEIMLSNGLSAQACKQTLLQQRLEKLR